ncbi:cytochrome P450 monooxygenase family 17 subfamily A (steroid 17alpha-monooxygenase) [Fusarium pseudoanthophilum]|uniref:Cytochrome P450 monooxygenase family 17 subfamily A (Steroid 17alpha-monooxygenase) n=1 Tax=Fusarium pseudoanthophilum TaxID=48495 RepID=A0A8H5KPE1_9HYPO|nr:cytochrome P450 monooxygenase family 17 subfamily A (steroid 17alpha-monooxygenase) [Fusarium pseudoanthophilum]
MTVPPISLLVLGIVAGAALFYLSSPTRKYRKRPLKLPIISAIHSSPIERPLLRWDDWVKENGAIATSKLFGIVPIVVINTAEAATELLGKRGAWYSNRPRSVGMEMITGAGPGKSRFTLMHDMDAHLKLHHRILSPSLGGIAAPRYQPVMELEAKQLVKHLVELSERKSLVIASDDVFPFLERAQASIILALHYGVRVPTVDDPLYQRVRETQAKVTSYASKPGLPDIFPFLANLPAVISPWHKAADDLFKEQKDLNLHLLSLGDDSPGWNATKQARSLAAKYAKEPISDIDLAFTLATSVQGGIETSTRTILWLFIAVTTGNRRFMKRAHDLLDAVVGRDRLPRFSDRSSLCYIDAIISELLRWRPISPGGVPRRADKQDYFNGISIAKNAMVLTNAWSIGRDDAVFDQSLGGLDEFIPERWLDGESMGTDIKNQGELRTSLPLPVFGHGRRSCLGKRVAVDGTFAQVATMIWAFDFELAEEVDEMEMEVVWFMTEPKPFKFKLKPRGPWVSKVIEEEWGTADKELGNIMGNRSDIES